MERSYFGSMDRVLQDLKDMKKISIIGLGYVGLPLAKEFSKYFNVVGYDKNLERIDELNKGLDRNFEFKKKDIKKSKIKFTKNIADIKFSDFFILTVPTPVTANLKPDLRLLISAVRSVAPFIKKGSMVIIESTVYPGVTEDVCQPILEKISNLKSPKDFYIGYSPERVNPGDKKNTVSNINKVVASQNIDSELIIYNLYKKIIRAQVFKAESIKVAEAAKVIENAQRDLNIAFVNELSLIFNKLNIKTTSVLKAASTKWNFLRFNPGLVGGHCIGVDPYYLTYIAKKNKYNPRVILSGRSVNNNMVMFILQQIKKIFKNKKITINLFGASFKENCADIRNSKSIELLKILKKNNYKIVLNDPFLIKAKLKNLHGIPIKMIKNLKKSDLCIFTVAHKEYSKFNNINLKKLVKKNGYVFDIKNIFNDNTLNNINYWKF